MKRGSLLLLPNTPVATAAAGREALDLWDVWMSCFGKQRLSEVCEANACGWRRFLSRITGNDKLLL